MPGTVKLDQNAYDFKNLQVSITGGSKLQGVRGTPFGIVQGVQEIEYSVTINREKFYGTSRVPLLETEGEAEFSGSITMHRYWFNYIIAKAKELKIPLAYLEMTLAVAYFVKGKGIVTDTLKEAKFQEIGNSHTNGPAHLMVAMPLTMNDIFFSGVNVFGDVM
jgi:hypothetical protein